MRIYGKRQAKIIKIIARAMLRGLAFMIPLVLLLIICTQAAGVRYMCVLSSSMEPELPVGSLIVVVPKRPEAVSEGENITYLAGGSLVTHKVIKNDEGGKFLITKGIAGKLEDAPVPYSAVRGVQKICIPGLGKLAAKLGSARGKIAVISSAAAIFIIVILADIITGRRRKNAANQSDLTAIAAENNI
ncbi:MAG: signal peptidase I [Clostridia bacterium]|nr:signal peptidase I [Clostridia bacterium]